ncbi:Cytochrome b5-related protein [Orchesella cincta]|uniref:Cytochrome b5-related protein n=1 Tax=Orchesella cincta TaxID=48709 RepID=A0A1D2MHT6_ORCCI|nr:Cytochrome b5-related protein [Orchesella cincta]
MAPLSSSIDKHKTNSQNYNADITNFNTMKSSFGGIFRYTGERGLFHPNIFEWLKVKRRDDDVGNYWRVHDKLYNLEDFIQKHPGGQDWIDFSRGTDITEAFESSHFVNVKKVQQTLAKYYVADAKEPRNSPYTFKENGFYKTLKRKAEPIIKEVGMEPSQEATLIQDSLFVAYMILAVLAVWLDSMIFQVAAGTALGMLTVGAHNFFHKKDSWRIFYYDLSSLSSYEWRISHAFSHHLFPNTILDYEVSLGEPMVEMLPIRPKSFLHKYIMPFVIDSLYGVYGLVQVAIRIISLLQGKQKVRLENALVILELVIFMRLAPTYLAGFQAWAIILTASSFWFAFVSNNSAHHHPLCFHDGDESRPDPDFGLCQLDATASKTDWYHQNLFSVLTTFGDHPNHHLFPTVCHGKLKYLKGVVDETLQEFSEELLQFTQWQLFVGTHQQLRRSVTHKFRKSQ